ncbi:MAG: hypothetical protein Tsb005_21610 [Gammaproteobacteria bacterium]
MLIYITTLFITFELLSILFNQFFYKYYISGLEFNVNISVVFFCISFFFLDIVAELYGEKIADKLIFAKLLAQFCFIMFGYIAIIVNHLYPSQLAFVIYQTPSMMINGMIASFIGYKVTLKILQKLRLLYQGKYLTLRYLFSTVPGEIIFSFIFSLLSFAKGRSIGEYISIFTTLTIFKVIFSLIFSVLASFLTRAIKNKHDDYLLREKVVL